MDNQLRKLIADYNAHPGTIQRETVLRALERAGYGEPYPYPKAREDFNAIDHALLTKCPYLHVPHSFQKYSSSPGMHPTRALHNSNNFYYHYLEHVLSYVRGRNVLTVHVSLYYPTILGLAHGHTDTYFELSEALHGTTYLNDATYEHTCTEVLNFLQPLLIRMGFKHMPNRLPESTKKWSNLIEADDSVRKLERLFLQTPDDEATAIRYFNAANSRATKTVELTAFHPAAIGNRHFYKWTFQNFNLLNTLWSGMPVRTAGVVTPGTHHKDVRSGMINNSLSLTPALQGEVLATPYFAYAAPNHFALIVETALWHLVIYADVLSNLEVDITSISNTLFIAQARHDLLSWTKRNHGLDLTRV